MDLKQNKRPYEFRKLSKKVIDGIVKDISEGSSNRRAARANGISEFYFYTLVKQGCLDLDNGLDSLPAYLVQSLAKVEQKEIKKCRKLIAEEVKGHHGAEWTLQYAYANDFGLDAKSRELDERLTELENSLVRRNHTYGAETKEMDSVSD